MVIEWNAVNAFERIILRAIKIMISPIARLILMNQNFCVHRARRWTTILARNNVASDAALFANNYLTTISISHLLCMSTYAKSADAVYAKGQNGHFRTISSAPAVIRTAPTPFCHVNSSPKKRIANITTNTTDSRSSAETPVAGPYLSATK